MRDWRFLGMLLGLLLATCAATSCRGRWQEVNHSKAAAGPPPQSFAQAKTRLAKLTGSAAVPLQGSDENGDPVATEGVSYALSEKQADALLDGIHSAWREAGYYVFRHERGYEIGGDPDRLGLLPTSDKYEVIRLMGTNGINYDLGTADVIDWLKSLERDEPFELNGIGFDYLEGRFLTPVDKPEELADMMYAFCPDIVDQGVGDVSELARVLREEGTLCFWWD